MDASLFADVQEFALYVFGPVVFWTLVILAAGSVLTALGTVVLSVVERMTR